MDLLPRAVKIFFRHILILLAIIFLNKKATKTN